MLKIATTYKVTTSHHQVVTFCNLAGTFQMHLLHHLEELSEPRGRKPIWEEDGKRKLHFKAFLQLDLLKHSNPASAAISLSHISSSEQTQIAQIIIKQLQLFCKEQSITTQIKWQRPDFYLSWINVVSLQPTSEFAFQIRSIYQNLLYRTIQSYHTLTLSPFPWVCISYQFVF